MKQAIREDRTFNVSIASTDNGTISLPKNMARDGIVRAFQPYASLRVLKLSDLPPQFPSKWTCL